MSRGKITRIFLAPPLSKRKPFFKLESAMLSLTSVNLRPNSLKIFKVIFWHDSFIQKCPHHGIGNLWWQFATFPAWMREKLKNPMRG
jgi:hypothetical protein